MIELWTDLPDHIVGLTAHGEVTADDYERTLMPAVEARLARNEKIRVIYHLAEDFTGFSAGALWDDAKLGMGHFNAWERIALVTDVPWIATTVTAIDFLIPSEVKVFPCEHLGAAREWIVAAEDAD
jgi:hypothetical protein